MHFDNSEEKFLSLTYGSQECIRITQKKKDCQGTSMISVKKNTFSNTILDILIIHKSHSMPLQQISQKMRYTNTL